FRNSVLIYPYIFRRHIFYLLAKNILRISSIQIVSESNFVIFPGRAIRLVGLIPVHSRQFMWKKDIRYFGFHHVIQGISDSESNTGSLGEIRQVLYPRDIKFLSFTSLKISYKNQLIPVTITIHIFYLRRNQFSSG